MASFFQKETEVSKVVLTEEIARTRSVVDLVQLFKRVASSEQLLLRSYEESILDRVIVLLSDQERSEFVTLEGYRFLLAGLTGGLAEKYQQALHLAINMGLADFAGFNRLSEQLNQELAKNPQLSGPVLLKSAEFAPKINGVRGAINNPQLAKGGRRGQKLEAQAVPSMESLPFAEMVANQYRFVLAMLQDQEQQQQLEAFEIFENSSINSLLDDFNVHDVVLFAQRFHPDSLVRQQALYVLEAITAAQAYIAEQVKTDRSENGRIKQLLINPQYQEKFAGLGKSRYRGDLHGAIMEAIFDHPTTQSNDAYFVDVMKVAGLRSERGLRSAPAFHERADRLADPLASEALALVMKGELKGFRDHHDYDGFVLPYSANVHGENVLMTWHKNITRDMLGDLKSGDLSHVKVDLPKLLSLSNEALRPTELAAVLAFLRPEVALGNELSLAELKNQARGGMFPISKRGISVRLDGRQEGDQLLTQMGLSKISFKRLAGPQTLSVSLKFGRRDFTFTINDNMEAPELAAMAPAEKDWLERVVFAYLVAVKNRDLYQQEVLKGDVADVEGIEEADLPPEQSEQRRGTSRSSHLYVLPYSHQPKDWDDANSEINLDVKSELGYSLYELNQHFVLAQENLAYLDTLNDETLKRIIVSALKRLEGKMEPENWRSERVQEIGQKIQAALLGKNPDENVGSKALELENVALIGFKHEPEDPVGEPLQMRLATVAKQLFALE